MNNIVYIPSLQEVPQWQQCYYHWTTLQGMIQLLQRQLCQKQKQSRQRLDLKTPIANTLQLQQPQNIHSNMSLKKAEQFGVQKLSSETFTKSIVPGNKNLKQYSQHQDFNKIINQWINLIIKCSDKQAEICYVFAQFKIFEITGKLEKYQNLFNNVRQIQQARSNMLILYQNLFTQSYYLQKALSYNLCQQKYIFLYFNNTLKNHNIDIQLKSSKKLQGPKLKNRILLNNIQLNCIKYHHELNQSSYRDLKNQKNRQDSTERFILGFTIGVICFLIGLLVLDLQSSGITLQTSKLFREHFPVWRGASYILLYFWILGITVLFYQKTHINYDLIFHYPGNKMPHSRAIFLRAAIFSLIYLVLFVVYVMQFTGTRSTHFQFYGEVFWALLIVYIFIPIPFVKNQSQIFFLKVLFQVIITPCIPMNFMIIWFTQQMTSFNQPMGDFFYTICYTATQDQPFCSSNSIFFSSAYIMFMFLYRIIQSLKFFHQITMARADKKYDFMAGPFLGSIRATLSLITAGFSLMYKQKLFEGAVYVWIAFAAVTGFYAWLVDLKGDWGMLDWKAKLLREKLLFPRAKIIYYLICISDLVLRTAWILSVSPFMINSEGLSTFLFVMMVSYLQILRRGIWNCLRVQFQHVKNCAEFQATVKDTHIYQKIKAQEQQHRIAKTDKNLPNSQAHNIINTKTQTQIKNENTKIKQQQVKKMRKDEQYKLLKQLISQRKQLTKQIEQQTNLLRKQLLTI